MSDTNNDNSGALIGLLFWAIVIGAVLFSYLRSDRADVFLNVTPGAGPAIHGTVLFNGAPVKDGKIYLVLKDAKNDRYIGSDVLAVDPSSGSFSRQDLKSFDNDLFRKPLIVTARFQGVYLDDKKERKAVKGEAAVYVNSSPPIDTTRFWTIVAVGGFLVLVLITLFTGSLTGRKARVLFSVTYLMTFLSLAVPIAFALLLSRNLGVIEMMEEAPIGVVKGTAKNVREAQWLVNIGGAVTRAEPAAKAPGPEVEAPALAEGTSPAAKTKAAPGLVGTAAAQGSPSLAAAQPTPTLVGGLVVPFYVVFLAMLGAGINMTRRVPEIQKSYANARSQFPPEPSFNWRTFWQLFAVGGETTSEEVADIRLQLIKSYMYLLSAPFLAIAVYYLLQIVAQSVTEPVLVVVAFATGLTSDAIVDGIIHYAGVALGKVTGAQGQQSQGPSKPRNKQDSNAPAAGKLPDADSQNVPAPARPGGP